MKFNDLSGAFLKPILAEVIGAAVATALAIPLFVDNGIGLGMTAFVGLAAALIGIGCGRLWAVFF